jgi:signal transduction histidine kinase
MTTANGRSVWVRSFGEPEFDGDRPVRLIGALQDITEQRERRDELRREQALRAQVERHAYELDELLRERNDMLDVMAHEVRQPLNNASAALQSASAALAEAGKTAAASRLKRAQRVLGQVLASVDNNLAVAALLARSKPIERMDTDIDTLVAMAIAGMPAAERRRVQIERLTPTRTASMDLGLMRLALRNLLANALKYSPPSEPVQVTLSDSDEPLALLIDVSDEGPGVDSDLVPRLFDRGTRGAAVGQAPGHGLGLYIVRRVMELHGGTVQLVHNAPGQTTLRLVVEQAPQM